MNNNKILYINYMIEEHNPDYLIIWETWCNEKPNMIDKRYEIFHTKFWRYQGVCIIARKDLVQKVYINDEPFLICIQVKRNKSTQFVIGAYLKENKKSKILIQMKHLINRIRKTYLNPIIYIFGDFNLDKNFNIDLIEDTLKINIDNRSKNLITRTQSIKGKEINSSLDLFLTTEPIEAIQRLDKNSSDHYPLLIITKTPSKESKRIKAIKVTERNYTDKDIIKLMENWDWPSTIDLPKTKQLVQKSRLFRPTIKIQESANKVFSNKENWENKEINIKTLLNENFREYVRNLDLWRTKDSKKFYKILQSLIRYKSKGKIVKGINEKGTILYGKSKDKWVKEYFQTVFQDNLPTAEITYNGIFDYTINIDEAIRNIAINKAVGWDYIPGEIFKIDKYSEKLKLRLIEHFIRYIETGYVPNYFMHAKLILISKDDTETPVIEKTRPISILPSITKIFEYSILHNLEKITQSPIFSKNQRGFTKGKSTLDNIRDIIQYAKELQIQRQQDIIKTATIIFFDFEKAYDNVPRKILMEKLQKLNLP